MGETKTYQCGGEDCGCENVLTISQHADGENYDVTITTVNGTRVAEEMHISDLACELKEAQYYENLFILVADGDQLSIILSDAQIADLRAWAGIVAQPEAQP